MKQIRCGQSDCENITANIFVVVWFEVFFYLQCDQVQKKSLNLSAVFKGCFGVIFIILYSWKAVFRVVQELGFQLCSLYRQCHYLSHDLAISAQALMTSGLNYCNSLYSGLVMRLICCLQLVQTAVVYLFVDFSQPHHIQLALHQLLTTWCNVQISFRYKGLNVHASIIFKGYGFFLFFFSLSLLN